MKRVAVWLSVMVCFFGSYQLYAAPSKVGPAMHFLFRFAKEYNWPRWVVVVVGLFIVVGGIAEYFDDKKEKEEKGKEQLVSNHGEKGSTLRQQ